MFNIFGIGANAIAPVSSFFELVKALRGNRGDETGQSSEDIVVDDSQEKQTEKV